MAKTHYIKILPEYYQATAAGNKLFELRLNDRDYQKNDKVVAQEFDGVNYTGKEIHAYITYIFKGGKFGLAKDYCILGIRKINVINPQKTNGK
jgi:uncharacterized protein DUF3850